METIQWKSVKEYKDIKYESFEGISKITINRPHVRNAFRPETVLEMSEAFRHAEQDSLIGVIVLTGEGKDAFCSGGDQKIRGDKGYRDTFGQESLNVLEFQRQIRRSPKPVIAMVAGFAIGGGQFGSPVLLVRCRPIFVHRGIIGEFVNGFREV